MSARSVKTPAKIFTSNLKSLENIILSTMRRISDIVGSSLGPGGRSVIIESELDGINSKTTKDGVSIFRSLGAHDPYEHLIIEQARDVAIRTVNEAGDGTTTATIIAAALIENLFNFCKKYPKYSPQKVARILSKAVKEEVVPFIEKSSIKIDLENMDLLEKVATISVNGDKDMAVAVIKAFEEVGYGASSHVTIQELSGPSGYEVQKIEGFPIDKGYEESIGKFHAAFINDQTHQRCVLENPLFILFDGKLVDQVQYMETLQRIGEEWTQGNSEFRNVVLVAHSFGDIVLTSLAFNFNNPDTINIVPLSTPMSPIANSQLEFLKDLSAFTGAKIFDMNNSILEGVPADFGKDMQKIEISRFRSTIVGDPDPMNIDMRANELNGRAAQSESKLEKMLLEERLGKLTSGIARLKIFGASNAELKEKADRAEDAVCSVRAAISHGCVPGGCRVLINAAMKLNMKDPVIAEVLHPSIMFPFFKLLKNAGYNDEEISKVLGKLIKNTDIVYDVENAVYGDAKELGVLDATLAVEQALKNAISIASVMGTLGGIVAFPRDYNLEMQNAKDEANFQRNIDHASELKNEAEERI
jgi:chaperonin GroEL